jgi:hypothetical protein
MSSNTARTALDACAYSIGCSLLIENPISSSCAGSTRASPLVERQPA